MKKRERGEIMLEALIVYSITLFLLFFILALFCVLFQHWNIQTIANESASRIGQTYRLEEADEVTGWITPEQIREVREYRYVWRNDELKDSATRKLEDYASQRLAKSTFTKNVTEPQFQVQVKNDALARRHIQVTITGEYAVPFGEILDYFGFAGITKYEVTAYAECLDLMDYLNTVNFVEEQISLDKFDSSFVKMVNNILELFNHIF